ncbi:MAG TPA: T9SS type A sorting domain-containing protein, partial [Phnomibacter sp.]|nr:T9SS type A sorting domain-containing protein [Phnomibacter sp.]
TSITYQDSEETPDGSDMKVKVIVNRTFKIIDTRGGEYSCTQVITVKDDLAPVLPTAPDAAFYQCIDDVPAPGQLTALDNCSGEITVTGVDNVNNSNPCNIIITRTWTFTDACSNSSSVSQTITVKDDTGPSITNVSVNQPMLWPVNHKMRDVVVNYNVADNCDGPVTTRLFISSNEPQNSTGDGNTESDWEIIDNRNVRLRAERAGNGDGRVYTITIEATDACGNISSTTTEVRVAHNITAPESGRAFRIGSTVNFTGTFWDVPGSRHTARWVIDGSTTTNGRVTAEPTNGKNGTATGSFKFNSAGVYKIRMEIIDQNGRVTFTESNGALDAIVVIFDPNGGYTYGGGSFYSPKGALPANGDASGYVSYGFQNNYFKSATNPKGETQFSFMIGDIEFNALNYEYLAVDKHRAQFRGSGRITGFQSGISFIMTVIDGDVSGGGGVDRVRMRIFNKNTGQVYYDNQPGSGEADDPITAVTAGSTVFIGGDEGSGGGTGGGGNGKPKATITSTEASLDIRVANNPATSSTPFRLQVVSSSTEKVNLRIVDVSGRSLESFQGITPGSTIETGSGLTKGLYFAEAVQGNKRVVVKLLKQ